MNSQDNQKNMGKIDGRDGFQVLITIKAKDIADSYKVWIDNLMILSPSYSLIVCLQ